MRATDRERGRNEHTYKVVPACRPCARRRRRSTSIIDTFLLSVHIHKQRVYACLNLILLPGCVDFLLASLTTRVFRSSTMTFDRSRLSLYPR